MKKQIEFTEYQESVVSESIAAIARILLKKLDDGYPFATFEGEIMPTDGRAFVSFEISAEPLEKHKP